MELNGEVFLAAPRVVIWRALNDPDILKQCIPGCEEIEQISETELAAKVVSKIGPIKAKFSGKVTLSDLDPPSSYVISGEGSGGAMGMVKGAAQVALSAEEGGTRLTYSTKAQIGGKLAQVGARMLDMFVKKTADEFFRRLVDIIDAGETAEARVA